jgi:arylsulfatase A-like enzyme
MTARRLAAAGALALLFAGCDSGPELETTHDLVAEAPFAELALEAGTIDIGTTAARQHLLDGWSWNETSPEGVSYSWGVGGRSLVSFDVHRPRSLQMRARFRPRANIGPSATMDVMFNDVHLSTLELQKEWQERDLTLPAELVQRGRNRLRFQYNFARPKPTPGDKRKTMIAWDWIRLAGFTGSEPDLDTESSTMALTAGTQIDYFLDLREGSQLVLDEIEVDAEAEFRLVATFTSDGSEETELAVIDKNDRHVRLPLAGSGLGRVRLSALADRHSRDPARAVLTRPSIQAPPLEATPVAAADGPSAPARAPLETGPRPNVLIYLVDTLRADRLGAYGNNKGLTPRLDRLAEEGIVFERAVGQSSWTLPAVASLFTGVWPLTHGAWKDDAQLPEELPILPQLLQAAGYHTGSFLTNGWIAADRGFDRGVDRFLRTGGYACEGDHAQTSAAVTEWLESVVAKEDGRPFYLYIHAREPHAPYHPPERFRRRFAPAVTDLEIATPDTLNAIKKEEIPPDSERLAQQLQLYDAEVACSDWAFENKMEILERLGVWDDTLVAFVGDHGEEFREHGSLTHGHSLYREMVGVPLILRLPSGEHGGLRIAWGGQHIDVMPTVLDYLGLPLPDHVRGRSLVAELPNSPGADELPPMFAASRDRLASVVYQGWKAIASQRRLRSDSTQLYDLRADPDEQTDLAEALPVRTGYFLSMIRREMLASKDVFKADSIEIDPETEAELRALGYLN